MRSLDYNGNILGIGGGIGEKQYDLGTNRATIPHQTGSTMKPIGAYCLALDYRPDQLLFPDSGRAVLFGCWIRKC